MSLRSLGALALVLLLSGASSGRSQDLLGLPGSTGGSSHVGSTASDSRVESHLGSLGGSDPRVAFAWLVLSQELDSCQYVNRSFLGGVPAGNQGGGPLSSGGAMGVFVDFSYSPGEIVTGNRMELPCRFDTRKRHRARAAVLLPRDGVPQVVQVVPLPAGDS